MVKHVIASFLLSLILAPGLLNAQGGSAPPGQKPQAPQSPPASTPAQPRSEPVFVIAPPAGGPGQSSAPSAPTPVNPNSYRIGLQDEVKITVFNEADLTNMYRVDADGSISFPFIGHVAAVGLTPAELQQRLTTLLAAGYIRNPQVRVEINQYKSQFVYVIGEVRAPGKIAMTGSAMTLLEALALAGSPTANASNEVIVVHPIRGPATGQTVADPEGSRIVVNRKDLELGKAGQDVVLQDGDIINVPSAQHFYITGMVRNPGTFVVDPGMNVQQAIALAGGLNDRGSDRRIKVSRVVNAKLVELNIELDDTIEPGDTVFISGRFF
jgi:polysaccharide export outer membrane protein